MSRRKILEAEYSSRNKEPFSKFSNGSNKKVWWKCTKMGCDHPHEWEATIKSRTNGSGCPFCTGQKVCPCKSLQTLKPDISAEWHPLNSLKPSEVSVSSHKKVWWECPKSGCDHPHEWEATINSRTNGSGCPFCSGRNVCPCKSLQTLEPDIAAEWHPRNHMKPSEVSVSSGKKVWWKCRKMGCVRPHEWEAAVYDRTNGCGCPFCDGRKVCPCNSLQTLKPDIAAEWHPRNPMKPSEVTRGSSKKVWWECPKSGCDHPHEWEAAVYDRTKENGTGCPFCAGQIFCPCNSLQTLKPDISAEWHPRNHLKPSEVTRGSSKKVWWKCPKSKCNHPHEWEATINSRTNGCGCPFCVGQKVCPCNSLQSLKPDIATEWHPRNNLKPSEVTRGSSKKVWWKCPKSGCNHPHEWEATINSRTKENGTGCPFCRKSKGEDKIMKILENRKINYFPQQSLNYKKLSFDFFLPDSNTAIEFDGFQHFEPVEFFGGEEKFLKQRNNDLHKNIYCSNNGINLLRIHYEDIEEIEFYLEIAFITKPFGENTYTLFSTNYI
jgi:hypothetical protein